MIETGEKRVARIDLESPDLMFRQLEALLGGERDLIANTANTAAFLYHALPQVNWTGFYFNRNQQLVLGPFQGQPACGRIELGKGVCGTAAKEQRILIVSNVHEFPGHIACDSASNSEIVVPVLIDQQVVGVLDIDSPVFDRFTATDGKFLEKVVGLLIANSDWSSPRAESD